MAVLLHRPAAGATAMLLLIYLTAFGGACGLVHRRRINVQPRIFERLTNEP
ncbi:MAG: hypothetical protein AB7G28_14800 [Pirellulales bacterium]